MNFKAILAAICLATAMTAVQAVPNGFGIAQTEPYLGQIQNLQSILALNQLTNEQRQVILDQIRYIQVESLFSFHLSLDLIHSQHTMNKRTCLNMAMETLLTH